MNGLLRSSCRSLLLCGLMLCVDPLPAQSNRTLDLLLQQVDQLYFLAAEHPDSVIRESTRLYQTFDSSNDKKGMADARYVRAMAHWYRSDYDRSLLDHMEAFTLRKKIKDSLGLARSYNNIGLIAQQARADSLANRYFHEAYRYRRLLGDTVGMIYSAVNVSVQQEVLGFQDSSRIMMERARKLANQSGEVGAMAFVVSQSGILEEKNNRWEEALNLHLQASRLLEEVQDERRLMESERRVLWCRFQLNPTDAREFVTLAKAIEQEARSKGWIELLSQVLYDLAAYYQALEMLDSAFLAMREHTTLHKQLDQGKDLLQTKALKAISNGFVQDAKHKARLAESESNIWKIWLGSSFLLMLAGAALGGYLVKRYQNVKKERNILEEEKRDAQRRNAELRRFSATVSHDIKEPIRSFIILVDMIRSQHPDLFTEGEIQSAFQDAQRRMEDLNFMIRDLEVYSGLSGGELRWEEVDLNEIFARVQRDLGQRIHASKANLKINKLPVIRAQKTLVYQIFSNLLSNGLKFQVRGNTPDIHVVWEQTMTGITLMISDNGIGIPRNYQHQIFQAFERGKAYGEFPGSGLGLAIVARAVELLGGSISLKSKEGKGTTFIIRLPMQPVRDGAETSGQEVYLALQ